MKNLFIICLLAIGLAGISSCGETVFQGLEASVDGDLFESDVDETSLSTSDDSFTLTGVSGLLGESITISLFEDFTGEGTYELSSGAANSAIFSPGAFTFDWYDSESGTITITTYTDDRAEGTFSFEGERTVDGVAETISITGGRFGIDR